jgi:hypothetical protein
MCVCARHSARNLFHSIGAVGAAGGYKCALLRAIYLSASYLKYVVMSAGRLQRKQRQETARSREPSTLSVSALTNGTSRFFAAENAFGKKSDHTQYKKREQYLGQ